LTLQISWQFLFLRGTLLASEPVGLSLFFENGQMMPLKLATTAPRYLQEVDIVVTTLGSAVDAGAQPLLSSGEFASLNWSGLATVDEDWRPALDGTFQRQRFLSECVLDERSGIVYGDSVERGGSSGGLGAGGFNGPRQPADGSG